MGYVATRSSPSLHSVSRSSLFCRVLTRRSHPRFRVFQQLPKPNIKLWDVANANPTYRHPRRAYRGAYGGPFRWRFHPMEQPSRLGQEIKRSSCGMWSTRIQYRHPRKGIRVMSSPFHFHPLEPSRPGLATARSSCGTWPDAPIPPLWMEIRAASSMWCFHPMGPSSLRAPMAQCCCGTWRRERRSPH